MATVDFSNIETPVKQSSFKYVQKGAQKLTIVDITEGNSTSGTPFMDITFHSDRFEADFRHRFYLSAAALPRVQSLMVGVTGSKLTGTIDTEKLIPQLIGKVSNFIVDAEKITKEKDGKVYENEVPVLRYADFASLTSEFKDEDAKLTDKTAPKAVQQAAGLSDLDDSDLPF